MKYCFTLLCMTCLFAQAQFDPSKVNQKAAQLFSKAQELTQGGYLGRLQEAINALQEAVRIDPRFADAYLSLGGMYQEQKNYQAAIENYEKARDIDSVYFLDYYLPYSINLAGKGEFQKALSAVNTFLSIPTLNETSRKAGEYRRKCYAFAVDYEKQKKNIDYHFEPRNLGDSVNSPFSEYYPNISIDGRKLIFTRRVNNNNEDFFESDLVNGQWTKARGLVGNINTNMNEGALSASQDGQWLIFTGCNFPEGYGSCDLYISYATPEGWSTPENLGNRINTEFWETAPSLSPDKRDLYFSSNRPGGYGGADLYVAHLLPNGRWSEPENMGPQINTPGDESTPFIHTDNQSLYFTSSGHPGYGSDDLFVTRKDEKGNWTKPENLGYPINTIQSEGSLVIGSDGKTAYYASDRADSRGGLDLYTFELRSDVRPARTLWVRGRVYDGKTHKGLPCAVELTDLATRQLISRVQTDETGNYLITLPVGKDYAFLVQRRGYLFVSENFPLSQKQPDSTYNIDIALQPLASNALIVLHNIFFDVNKYDLKNASQVELDRIVQLLKENATLKIEIIGHTDNVGKSSDNLKLSASRAQSVVAYLAARGIDPGRLIAKGLGDTQPVASNNTEAGRSQNRRTELKVISQ